MSILPDFRCEDVFFGDQIFQHVMDKFAIQNHKISCRGPQVVRPCFHSLLDNLLIEDFIYVI